jgi:hypothetical protein
MMCKALVLIRNLSSNAKRLDFGEFTISVVGLRYEDLSNVLLFRDVKPDDWIFEKSYNELPPGPVGSSVGGVPDDVEDILLLFRLYSVGDIAFIRAAITTPKGNTVIQPYRAMNDLNSYSRSEFELKAEECGSWKTFATGVQQSQSWTSDWFATARRFFLSGGAKPFNPSRDDVDRIVDYATALESALVPEKDYNTRRISRRAAALVAGNGSAEQEFVTKLVTKFYDIRSTIVHGCKLRDKQREWLIKNNEHIELRIRRVLSAAVQKLPPGEEDRRIALAGLYDPADEDRGSSAFDKFGEIKTAEVRKAIAAKIALLAGE